MDTDGFRNTGLLPEACGVATPVDAIAVEPGLEIREGEAAKA